MTVKRILKIWILCCSLFSFNSLAANSNDAQKFIEDLSQNVIEIIKNDKLDDRAKSRQLSNMFTEIMDIKWISKFVLGPHYRELSEQQFKQFNESYRNFLVNKYVPKFKHYNREVIKILGVEEAGEGRFKVSTIIDRTQEADVKVDYMVKYNQNASSFKIFDIIAEEISMITTHRTEFGSLIEQKGFDEMLKHVREEK